MDNDFTLQSIGTADVFDTSFQDTTQVITQSVVFTCTKGSKWKAHVYFHYLLIIKYRCPLYCKKYSCFCNSVAFFSHSYFSDKHGIFNPKCSYGSLEKSNKVKVTLISSEFKHDLCEIPLMFANFDAF